MTFERLILATASPRRIDLFRQLGMTFEVLAALGQEPLPEEGESAADYVQRMAEHKAHQVQQQLCAYHAWVIGADTVVVLDDQILGKPDSEGHAKDILSQLSGRQHEVITGFSILHQSKGILHKEAVTTSVWFRELTPFQITRYVKTGEPMDKAGAYGIQGKGAVLVEKIDGCYFNVVGLPLSHVIAALETHGAGTLF